MPTREETAFQIAHQMMKSGKIGRVKATKKQIFLFKLRHEVHINWAIDNLPYVSSAVAAVVVKSLIRYDKQLVGNFCKALKKQYFEGKDDPVYLLWRFLQIHKGKNTSAAYGKTNCAIKTYVEGKKIYSLYPAKRDVFDWDDDFTVPDNLLPIWNPNEVPA